MAFSSSALAAFGIGSKNLAYDLNVFGAVGDGVTNDSAAIQFALDVCAASGGGRIVAKPGVYIADNLRVGDNTTIDFPVGPAVTIRTPSPSSRQILSNKGIDANRSFADANITSGSTTLTSATANFTAADVGRSVRLPTGGPGGYPFATKIVARVSATQVTLEKAAGATVTNGAASIHARTKNATIRGGSWEAVGTYTGTNSERSMGLVFVHTDGLTIEDVSVQILGSRKYCILVADADRFVVQNIRCGKDGVAATSDGVHFIGPATWGFVQNVFGATGDNGCALTGVDYLFYSITGGDCANIEFRNIHAIGPNGIFKILAGYGRTAKNMLVDGVRVTDGFGTATVYVGDDPANPETTNGTYENIIVRNVTGVPNIGYYPVEIRGGAFKSILVDGIQSATNAVRIVSGSTVNDILIRNLQLNSTSGAGFGVLNEGAVGSLVVDGVQYRNASTGTVVADTGTTTRLSISNASQVGGDKLVASGTNDLVLSSVRTSGANYIVAHSANVTQVITCSNVRGSANTALVANIGSGGITLQGDIEATSGTLYFHSGTKTLRVNGQRIAMDISKITAPVQGDRCFNTTVNATGGYGPVVYNGYAWVPDNSHSGQYGFVGLPGDVNQGSMANNTSADLRMGTSDFSMFAWVYLDANPSTNANLFSATSGSAALVILSSGILRVDKSGTASIGVATTSIPLKTWTLVGYVRSAGVGTFYIGGRAQNTIPDATDYNNGATQMNGQYVNGAVAYPQLWKRALSSADIADLLAQSIPKTRTSLSFALLTSSPLSGGTVLDVSGNGHHYTPPTGYVYNR